MTVEAWRVSLIRSCIAQREQGLYATLSVHHL
jgi:hypothetical protein